LPGARLAPQVETGYRPVRILLRSRARSQLRRGRFAPQKDLK